MMAPRWRKALADIAERPGRSALAVLAMAIGIGALGTMVFKQALLGPVLGAMYGATEPASATLYVDRLDDGVMDVVRAVPGVGDVEARPMIMARIRVGAPGQEAWLPAFLYVLEDFTAQRLNLVRPDAGAWPPADGEILLERTALSVARAAVGDTLALQIPGGSERSLRLAGTAYAAGLAPAWMEHVVYGFVTKRSLARRGPHRESSQILLRVAEHRLQEGHIREVAGRAQAALEARGVAVRRVQVPEPDQHPHQRQMDTFMFLVGSFALLAFVLGAVLTASLIQALQSEQVRQIGIMKAIGATRAQVAGVYLVHVGMLAGAAVAIGVPLAWVAGRGYARFSADILNADVSGSPFPLGALALVVAVGLIAPLLVALVPVWRAARITVREALADVGGARPPAADALARAILGIRWLPRPQLVVLRSALARRGRFALAAGMLALAGATFMAALNCSAAWDRATKEDFARRHYDIIMWLATPRPVDSLDRRFAAIPGVARAEYWPGAPAWLIGADGAAGRELALLGVEPSSTLLDPHVTAGRWLDPAVVDGAVLNSAAHAMYPALAVGDTVRVRHEGRTLAFPIVGIVQELLVQPIVYVPEPAMLAATGVDASVARTIRVVTETHDAAGRAAAARGIEAAFAADHVEIARLFPLDDMRGAVIDHLVIIKVILLLAAGLVILVGTVGLTSALTISVVQRTREIGIMGALGATPRALALGVWSEGMLIALTSWAGASLLTAPVSAILQRVTGNMFFAAPLPFTLAPGASFAWLGLVLVLATLSSVQPCLHAARMSVREAVAHA